MLHSEQTHLVNYPENEITSDSNIIPYSQYLLETQNEAVQDTNSSVQQDVMILFFADFEKEINSLKQILSEQLKEKKSLTKTFNVLKNDSKEKEAKNIDKEIALEKKVKELDNIVYKMGQSAQTVHMLTKPQVFYDNNLKQALDFGKRFVPQQELSAEQAFQLQTSHPNTDQSASSPFKIEAPRELPKITPDALTEEEWGFEHTKAVFLKEIISFLKTLKDIFNVFDKDLLNEVRILKKWTKIKAKRDKAEHEKERVHKSQKLSSYG
ncbi:hypothetical protein Tco_0421248 [Tanacetum coccineum]